MITPEISTRQMDLTKAIKDYCVKKIEKYDYLFERATEIKVELSENKNQRGVDRDFGVEIYVSVPNTKIFVREEGSDLYAMIDKATDTISRKLKRYKDRLSNWEGEKTWESEFVDTIEGSLDEGGEFDDYSNYIPKIARRKSVSEEMPMHEAEAIERMELLDLPAYMFKHFETGKWCVVMKGRSGYILIES